MKKSDEQKTCLEKYSNPNNWETGMYERLSAKLEEMRNNGTFKQERVITTQMGSSLCVVGKDKPVINMCANNYLGLSNHPRLLEAAKRTLDSHGFGMSSVRFICGTQNIHKELERAIADFHGKEDAILFPTCFDANVGLFDVILGPEDAVISDSLNHASIIDGIRLCKAARLRYNHIDMEDLERKLQETSDKRTRLIATDGAFSMDGDIAPLDKIVELAERYDALIFVDESHATGFVGATGRGTLEHFGVTDKIDIVNSTLGKALGGATGGYTTGRNELITMLRQNARTYLFTNSIAPVIVGASIEVFKILNENSDAVEILQSRAKYFRKRLRGAGFTVTGEESHPIVSVMLGDAILTKEFANELLENGIYAIGFSYPVVAHGKARIRTQLSLSHSDDQIEHAISSFIRVGKNKGVL